jgi:uracil-DNA glycosylase
MDLEKLKNLKEQIEICDKCKEKIGEKNISMKNYPFKKGFDFVPEEVKIMFIAEEPPNTGNYFYEKNKRDSVRSSLFGLLKDANIFDFQSIDIILTSNIEDATKDFTKKGFYLADIVKCPNGSAKDCLCFLKHEIEILNPRIICTLGNKATKTFVKEKNIKFEEIIKDNLFLQKNRIIDDFNSYKIFPCYFPTTTPVTNKEKVERFKMLKNYLDNDKEFKNNLLKN